MAGILKVDQVQSDSNLSFQVAGANVAYMNSTGLQMTGGQITAGGNTLLTASGLIYANAGIAFPATQVNSGNANTLDDYEEGTWTLTVTPASGSFTVANQTGSYVKIGRCVYVNMWWRRTGESSLSGAITVSGFPFPFASDATDTARQRLWLSGYNFASLSSRSALWVIGDGGGNATTGTLFALTSDYSSGTNIAASAFSGVNTELYINGFYMTN